MIVTASEFKKMKIKKKRKNKYNAKSKIYNGRKFQSTFEADYARMLDLRKSAHDPTIKVMEVEHQVPFQIVVAGKKICKYVLDFKFTTADGLTHFIDTKGSPETVTAESKLKIKLVEVLYDIHIRLVYKSQWK